MKKIIFSLMLLASQICAAQTWKMGVTVGGDINDYSIDTQYQYDWRYHDAKGLTVGVICQYQLNEWFALRTDINYTQKNYRQNRTGKAFCENYKHHNSYVQLPLMASFSFGGERLRGFLNLGAYGAYWAGGSITGTTTEEIMYDILDEEKYDMSNIPAPVDQSYPFNSVRDNRIEFGTVGGVGMEYSINDHWAVQGEIRMYYALTSTTKDYMIVRNPRFNTTTAIQLGCAFCF